MIGSHRSEQSEHHEKVGVSESNLTKLIEMSNSEFNYIWNPVIKRPVGLKYIDIFSFLKSFLESF